MHPHGRCDTGGEAGSHAAARTHAAPHPARILALGLEGAGAAAPVSAPARAARGLAARGAGSQAGLAVTPAPRGGAVA